jgi:hypothetical protein
MSLPGDRCEQDADLASQVVGRPGQRGDLANVVDAARRRDDEAGAGLDERCAVAATAVWAACLNTDPPVSSPSDAAGAPSLPAKI